MIARTKKQTLRIDEVAALFCVCPKTIRNWIKAGKITVVIRILGTQRIPASEIARLIEEARR